MAAAFSALRSVRSEDGLRSREQVGHSEALGTVTEIHSVTACHRPVDQEPAVTRDRVLRPEVRQGSTVPMRVNARLA
jgi:hypothetical protein